MPYSELIKFQRPMEGLLAGLRFLLVDERVDLKGEQLINRLANLRELRIRGNRLDEATLNQFARQFKFLTILLLDRCEIKGQNLDLLPNHSVHFLLIERCTAPV